MSRMSKYLRQTCSLERVETDVHGDPVLNVYGEPTYLTAETISCRKERYVRDVETATGAVVKSSTQYYTDEEVGINDKLDSRVVLSVEEYTGEDGNTEGFRSIT